MQFTKFLKSKSRTFGATGQGPKVVTKTNTECGTFYRYIVFHRQ